MSTETRRPPGSRRRVRTLVKSVFGVVLAAGMLPILLVVALAARLSTGRRKRQGLKPRVLWGLTPIIPIKYWSASLERLGYQTQTVVDQIYHINQRADFDQVTSELAGWLKRVPGVRAYVAFCRGLAQADVFHYFFHGGFLSDTPLWRAETAVLHLARKKIIVSPYGSDIAVPGYLGVFEAVMVADYPRIVRSAGRVRRFVDFFARRADFVVRNLQVGYLPRADVFWPTQLAIDTTYWTAPNTREAGRRHSDVLCIHAANHRRIKGTDDVVRAVKTLRDDGLPVRLEVLEGVANEVVRRAIGDSDIVIDQLVGGYGMLAIEAMSMGRPVLSNTGWWSPAIASEPSLAECPIIDANAETIEPVLRALVADAERRRALGKAGRRYAERHHSLDAVGHRWAHIADALWTGEPRSTQ